MNAVSISVKEIKDRYYIKYRCPICKKLEYTSNTNIVDVYGMCLDTLQRFKVDVKWTSILWMDLVPVGDVKRIMGPYPQIQKTGIKYHKVVIFWEMDYFFLWGFGSWNGALPFSDWMKCFCIYVSNSFFLDSSSI